MPSFYIQRIFSFVKVINAVTNCIRYKILGFNGKMAVASIGRLHCQEQEFSTTGHPSGKRFLGRINGFLRRRGIGLQCDVATEARGNCWVYAVMQQLHRPDVATGLCEDMVRLSQNSFDLRMGIVNFVKTIDEKSEYYAVMTAAREATNTIADTTEDLDDADSRTWENKLLDMGKNYMWFDTQFMQFTAYFLKMDIICYTKDATTKFCGDVMNQAVNRLDSVCRCPESKLNIANLDDTHFQSLVPLIVVRDLSSQGNERSGLEKVQKFLNCDKCHFLRMQALK